MIPNPKYKIGDKVWKIVNGKAEEVTVYAVGVYKVTDENLFIKYRIGPSITHKMDLHDDETTLFPTKEELIASL